jgi:hypothetical protein
MSEERSQRSLTFLLNKKVVQELELEELEAVSGGATASCCLGCHTDGTATICP